MKAKNRKLVTMAMFSSLVLLTSVKVQAQESVKGEQNTIEDVILAPSVNVSTDAERVTPDILVSDETNRSIETEIMNENEDDIMKNNVIVPVTETNELTTIHQWHGAVFGESTNDKKNSVTVNEDGTVTLKSANFDSETKIITDKGGKFTAFHDGITYYYTEIDAANENFEFMASFHVDYLNPKADGQEGFGIIVRDSIGQDGVGNEQFPTNSAALLATRVRYNDDNGERIDLKPGIASRQVVGLTPEVIAAGGSSMAESGSNTITPVAFSKEISVAEGATYTFKVKKTNTGYHMVYETDTIQHETILYGTDKLLQIDKDKVYLGIATARGVNVTVSDMMLKISDPKTDAPEIEEPKALINPEFKVLNYRKTGNREYALELLSNVPGTATIESIDGQVLGNVNLQDNYYTYFDLHLYEGDNQYKVTFTPSMSHDISNQDPIMVNALINHKTYPGYYKNNIGTYLFVSPEGNSDGSGLEDSPLDIQTAIDYLQPGQMIELAPGIYHMSKDIIIHRGNSGTANLKKFLGTQGSEPAIFDFSKGGAFILNGSHWIIDNVHIRNTQGNIKGLTIGGHYNKVQRIEAYNNGDTGIQISGSGTEHPDFWPSFNIVENSTSYNNVDPGHNNADGFAAKITVGQGNIFRGNIAYNNIDDGWDLFAKLETGPIGIVTIEDSIAFANGHNSDGTVFADGNGFKLGGDGIPVGHVLRRSLAYLNDADGITSNSNPDARVYGSLSVFNKGTNLSLYGKGNAKVTSEVSGLITWKSGEVDQPGNQSVIDDPTNYISGTNNEGKVVDESWFINTSTDIVPIRHLDGSINLNGLFVLVNEELSNIKVLPVTSQPLRPAFRLVTPDSSDNQSDSSDEVDDIPGESLEFTQDNNNESNSKVENPVASVDNSEATPDNNELPKEEIDQAQEETHPIESEYRSSNRIETLPNTGEIDLSLFNSAAISILMSVGLVNLKRIKRTS